MTFTTGTTASEYSRVLFAAGAREVHAITLARVKESLYSVLCIKLYAPACTVARHFFCNYKRVVLIQKMNCLLNFFLTREIFRPEQQEIFYSIIFFQNGQYKKLEIRSFLQNERTP